MAIHWASGNLGPTPVLRESAAGSVASWYPRLHRAEAERHGVFVAPWAVGRWPCWELAPGLEMVVEAPVGQCPSATLCPP